MVHVQRRPVIDEPEPPVPDQQVHVAHGPIDVRGQRVEPDDVGRQVGVGRRTDRGRERQRSRQEVEPEVQARRSIEQLVDLAVGLRAPQLRIDIDEDDLGNEEAQRLGEAARHHDQGQRDRRLAQRQGEGPALVTAVVAAEIEPR